MGLRAILPLFDELRGRQRQRDVAARDRGRARAAVGLQNVAVDRDRVLAERIAVDDGAQAAADEPLNLERAAALRAARSLALACGVCVARGSMPYSAVTQPWPLPLRNGGTFASTEAVQSTRVSPNSASTDPSAWRVKCGVSRTSRISSRRRPLGRIRSSVRGEGFATAYQLAR